MSWLSRSVGQSGRGRASRAGTGPAPTQGVGGKGTNKNPNRQAIRRKNSILSQKCSVMKNVIVKESAVNTLSYSPNSSW